MHLVTNKIKPRSGWSIYNKNVHVGTRVESSQNNPYELLCKEIWKVTYKDYIYYLKIKYGLCKDKITFKSKSKLDNYARYKDPLIGMAVIEEWVYSEESNFEQLCLDVISRDFAKRKLKKIKEYYKNKYESVVQ